MADDTAFAPYLAMFEEYYFEVGEAFKDLSDDKVWVRPAEGLLSVGELAGHVAYWEAVRYAGSGQVGSWQPDLGTCRIKSPLVQKHFHYYGHTLADPLPDDVKAMTAAEVHQELGRVHQESMKSLLASGAGLDDQVPGWPDSSKVKNFITYSLFHISYHTGQMYTVRHLLGDVTPDN